MNKVIAFILSTTLLVVLSGCSKAQDQLSEIGSDIQNSAENITNEYNRVKETIEETTETIETTQKDIEEKINTVSSTIDKLQGESDTQPEDSND